MSAIIACGLCDLKTNDAEAFASHMRDKHGWADGQAIPKAKTSPANGQPIPKAKTSPNTGRNLGLFVVVGVIALFVIFGGGGGKSSPSSQGVTTPAHTPTPTSVYRPDQLILPPEQFPLPGYTVTADGADKTGTGWRRDFSPSTPTSMSPAITVVVSLLQPSDAANPEGYLNTNGICGGKSLVVLPTTDGGLISCRSENLHDAQGHAGQIGTLTLSRPLGYGGFAEQIIVDRYLIAVTTKDFADTTGQNASLMSKALLTVGQTQAAIVAKLTQ